MKNLIKLFSTILSMFFLILIGTETISFLPQIKASAQSERYLRIITSDTPFYIDATDSQPLFYLPYTYYVKVISQNEMFYQVEYGGLNVVIDGYIPTSYLYEDNLEVTTPYPLIKIKTSETATLYQDKNLSTPLRYVFKDREATFLGIIPNENGTSTFYVCYYGQFGYIKEQSVYPFTIQNHPNELTFIKKDEPEIEPEPQTDKDYTSTLRILIISSLAIALVSGIVIIKKKPTKHKADRYYDENEYE